MLPLEVGGAQRCPEDMEDSEYTHRTGDKGRENWEPKDVHEREMHCSAGA